MKNFIKFIKICCMLIYLKIKTKLEQLFKKGE